MAAGHAIDRVVDSQHEIDADYILTSVMHRRHYGAKVREELAEALSLIARGIPLAKRNHGPHRRTTA